jgi:hypothetical protein
MDTAWSGDCMNLRMRPTGYKALLEGKGRKSKRAKRKSMLDGAAA